jgi:hypothetical protein
LQEQATLLLCTSDTAEILKETLFATSPTAARNAFYAPGRGGFYCMRQSGRRSIVLYRRNRDNREKRNDESFLSAFSVTTPKLIVLVHIFAIKNPNGRVAFNCFVASPNRAVQSHNRSYSTVNLFRGLLL